MGLIKTTAASAAVCAVALNYWVLPKLDAATPWEGAIPGSCGAAPPVATGWPAMWHDLGRHMTSEPPTGAELVAWAGSLGTSSARSISNVKAGAAGQPVLLPLAPLPPPSAPLQASAPGALTDAQVAQLAAQAGWPVAEIPNVVARVRAESTGNPRARDYADGTHWGLLQLGTAERARYIAGQDAFDPLVNLRGARLLWEERGWQPWAASDGAVVAVESCPTPGGGGGAMQASFKGRYANGEIPDAELRPLSVGGKLHPDAARDFELMNAAYTAQLGKPIGVTDSYRSRAGQEACTRAKGSMCAKPGTSNHGWGLALDLGDGVQRFGSREHQWMVSYAGQFGWVLPSWAQQNGSKPEPWHWEYQGTKAQQAG